MATPSQRYSKLKTVHIDLPDDTLAGFDREPDEVAVELRRAAAVKLYELGRVSQEVAAAVAGVDRAEFVLVLSRMAVSPLQETAEEALHAAEAILSK